MKKLICMFCCILSFNVFAGFSPGGKITHLYTNGYWVLVQVDNTSKHNPADCANTSYYGINLTSDASKTLYSTLLAAKLSQKNVTFWIAGCAGQSNSYPRIDSIKMSR